MRSLLYLGGNSVKRGLNKSKGHEVEACPNSGHGRRAEVKLRSDGSDRGGRPDSGMEFWVDNRLRSRLPELGP